MFAGGLFFTMGRLAVGPRRLAFPPSELPLPFESTCGAGLDERSAGFGACAASGAGFGLGAGCGGGCLEASA